MRTRGYRTIFTKCRWSIKCHMPTGPTWSKGRKLDAFIFVQRAIVAGEYPGSPGSQMKPEPPQRGGHFAYPQEWRRSKKFPVPGGHEASPGARS
jgi:hypothetical protein